MFISVRHFLEDRTHYDEWINAYNINEVNFYNPRNIEQGIVIVMKNNRQIYVEETMDKFAPRLKKVVEESAVVMYADVMAQMLERDLAMRTRKRQPRKK